VDDEHIRVVGRLVRRRRRALKLGSQAEAATAAGVSPTTWEKIENGRQISYSADTYDGVDQALRWEAGTLEAALNGGDLTGIPTGPEDDGHEVSNVALLAVLHEIRDGLSDLAEVVKSTLPQESRTRP
jgi:transcriptional regulator with XRE-family HTH domain